MRASLFSGAYKDARAVLRSAIHAEKCADADLVAHARAAQHQLQRWRELRGTGIPSAPALEELDATYAELSGDVARLAALTRTESLENQSFDELRTFLEALISDRGTLTTLPRLH